MPVTTSWLWLGLMLVAMVACSGGRSQSQTPLLRGLDEAPGDIRADCRVAGKRCVQCHPVERVLMADIDSPRHWQRYVARMRLQPGSHIDRNDASRIERCLIYRSFGADAVDALTTRRAP